MSESEISVTDGSIPSPVSPDASGGLEANGPRASTPRIDQKEPDYLDRYATKHDIRHLEDVIARVESGVGSELRRLETSLNSTSAVLDGRIYSLEKRLDDRISSLEKRMDEKFDGLKKTIDDSMTNLKELRNADLKVRESDLKAYQSDSQGVHKVVYFCITLTLVVAGAVFTMALMR
jgi:hypothetical protein